MSMVDTSALFRIGDAAEEAGNLAHALKAFERGAALGNVDCLCRLAYLFDTGTGVEADKATAIRLYQRARRSEPTRKKPVEGHFALSRNCPVLPAYDECHQCTANQGMTSHPRRAIRPA